MMNLNSFSYYYPFLYIVETIMTLCVKSMNTTTANIYRNNHDESEFIFLLLPLSLYCRDHYDLMCEINEHNNS